MTRKKAYRPEFCWTCSAPLQVASTGRVRETCSDRCRQIRRRRSDYRWEQKQRWARHSRRAAHAIHKLEQHYGKARLDRWLWSPDDPYTTRDYLQTYLERERPTTPCRVCGFPVMRHTVHTRIPVCSDECEHRWYKTRRGLFAYFERQPLDLSFNRALFDGFPPVHLCQHCGTPYKVTDRRQRKYCSPQCRKKAWWARNPHYRCLECGGVCPARRHLCSHNCAMRYYRRAGCRCARCHRMIKPGAEILPNADTRRPHREWRGSEIYCSARCRDALGWSPSYKTCEECRQIYYPDDQRWQRRQRFCSDRCRDHFNNRLKMQRRRDAAPVRVCQHCASLLPDSRQWVGVKRWRYCSDACQRAAQTLRRQERRPLSLGIPVRLPVREAVGVAAIDAPP